MSKDELYRLLADESVSLDYDQLVKLEKDVNNQPDINRLDHPEVRYEVTNKCNATCIMCPRDKQNRSQGIMSQELYENSIDEVVSLGAKSVVLTGFGEPLLDKKLENKIRYASKRGLSTYFITNASGLTSKRSEQIIESGLNELRISFYGMSASTYNAVMKGLDFYKTKDNILSFIEKNNKLSNNVKVQLSYLEMNENKNDDGAFIEYWEPLVDAIEVWRPHNFGDGRDYRERSSECKVIEKNTCGRPVNGPLQIQWDGDVVPCCYDYNNAIVLGNAFKDNVIDVLNSFKYKLLRYAHGESRFNIFPFCDQCDQLLPHADALVYTNRHNLSAEDAVKLSNTDLYDLSSSLGLEENHIL